MAKEKESLIRFVEKSPGFDNKDKLKLILLILGVKPATYVHLKIEKNLQDKHRFEELLRKCGILFKASRPKGFEEIVKVAGNEATWRFEGTWYGYDLFSTEKNKKLFEKYVELVKKQRHKESDLVAGKLYGYPACCIKAFIHEQDERNVAKKYSYYSFYKRLHDSDKVFPFVMHTLCSPKCKQTMRLNDRYKQTVKKYAPAFFRKYASKKRFKIKLIVDTENDLEHGRKSVWAVKDGHDYNLVTKQPIEKKYYLISWLSKKEFKRGTILEADVAIQYDYAIISNAKEKGFVKNFHHERKFLV